MPGGGGQHRDFSDLKTGTDPGEARASAARLMGRVTACGRGAVPVCSEPSLLQRPQSGTVPGSSGGPGASARRLMGRGVALGGAAFLGST
jgi:hypothetical protein